MSEMHLDYTRDGSKITVRLHADFSEAVVSSTFEDTDTGVNLRTVITHADGTEDVVLDKTDRATPPLTLMLEMLHSYQHAFLHNAQAGVNEGRYQRLKERGGFISMRDMCMDGLHMGPEFAEVPFEGGIVGVPEHHENEPEVQAEEPVQLNSALLSDLDDIFDMDEGEAA